MAPLRGLVSVWLVAALFTAAAPTAASTQFNQTPSILWGAIEQVLSTQVKPIEAPDDAASEAKRILKEASLI